MAEGQAEAHVLAMNERVFLDDSNKDVTFELADGREYAHKVFLIASSDVFGRMFQQDMQEKTTGVIALPDVRRSTMRVFLRLVYCGHVDPSDWADAKKASEEEDQGRVTLSRQLNVRVSGRRLTSTAVEWCSVAVLGNSEGGFDFDFEFSVRAESWQDAGPVMIGIVPLGTDPCQFIYEAHGFYGYVCDGKLATLHAEDGTMHKPFSVQGGSPLPAGATITARFHGGRLYFAVNGGAFATARFRERIPDGVLYCPAISFGHGGTTVEVLSEEATACNECPLDILVGVASLAKKYLVAAVLSMATHALKERIAKAKQGRDVSAFEQILAAAISGDLDAVRMAALDSARDFVELRSSYHAGSLRPEVAHNLEAIWPPRLSKRLKRTRLA